MTGRNRNQRLSDAQRSAVWYMDRGYSLVRGKVGPAGSLNLVDYRLGGGWGSRLPIARRVLDALLSRGLVELSSETKTTLAYRLTGKGRAVADEVRARMEAKP